MIQIWKEVRYGSTPFPEYRIRVRILGLTMTVWRWDG